MVDDEWLLKAARDLSKARSQSELMEVVDRLEDQYDAFSGPGLELVEQLLEEGRRRLRGLP